MSSFQGGLVCGFLPQGDDVKLADFARRLYQYRYCVARRMSFRCDGTLVVRPRMWNYYANAESGDFHEETLNPYTGKVAKRPSRTSPPIETTMSPAPPQAETKGPCPPESSLTGRRCAATMPCSARTCGCAASSSTGSVRTTCRRRSRLP